MECATNQASGTTILGDRPNPCPKKTPSGHHSLVSERIKHYVRTVGPVEPEIILEKIHHKHPGLISLNLWTLLFSGEMSLNGFGELCLLKPDTREYLYEEIQPVDRTYRVKPAPRNYPHFDAAGSGRTAG